MTWQPFPTTGERRGAELHLEISAEKSRLPNLSSVSLLSTGGSDWTRGQPVQHTQLSSALNRLEISCLHDAPSPHVLVCISYKEGHLPHNPPYDPQNLQTSIDVKLPGNLQTPRGSTDCPNHVL